MRPLPTFPLTEMANNETSPARTNRLPCKGTVDNVPSEVIAEQASDATPPAVAISFPLRLYPDKNSAIEDSKGRPFASVWQHIDRDRGDAWKVANRHAEFIVRACNTHAGLIAALNEAVEYVEQVRDSSGEENGESKTLARWQELLREAHAQAA